MIMLRSAEVVLGMMQRSVTFLKSQLLVSLPKVRLISKSVTYFDFLCSFLRIRISGLPMVIFLMS